jgi:hypothetical protein
LLNTDYSLQPFAHLVFPDEFERAGANDQNGERLWVKQAAGQRLDRLSHSHLIANQYPSVVVQAKCKGLPLERVKLGKKRVTLQNVLLALQNQLIDVQSVIVSSDHLQKVGRRLEVIRQHLRQLPPDELHLNSTCFPNLENWTPNTASPFYYLFDGFAPHAERNADSFFLIGNAHEDYPLFPLLPLRLALAL